MTKDSVIIVIPVYNEEKCIEKVVADWGSELTHQKVPFEILLVNDGSTDNTESILDRLANEYPQVSVIHQENQGHGKSVKNGYIYASNSEHNYVFQTDSDDQFSAADFVKVWELRSDVPVFGHRVSRKDPVTRKMISFFVRKTIMDWFEVDIPDANVPYRLFSKTTLQKFNSVLEPGLFAPNLFLSILSFKSFKKCPVVGVQHFAREADTQKLMSWGLVRACLLSFWQLLTFYYQLPKKLEYIDIEDTSAVEIKDEKQETNTPVIEQPKAA